MDKYGWVDVGSSFLPSEFIAAFLWAQLENIDQIQKMRKNVWKYYENEFLNQKIEVPAIPNFATNNAHMFYIVCKNLNHQFVMQIIYIQKNIII